MIFADHNNTLILGKTILKQVSSLKGLSIFFKNLTKRYQIFLLILIFNLYHPVSFCNTQQQIDSLRRVSLKSAVKDKIVNYNQISELFWNINLDSSIYYANLALSYAEKNEDQRGMANAQNNLGGAYFYLSDYYNAIKHFNIALEFFRKLGLKQYESSVMSNLSGIYISMGISEKALDYNYKAYKISEELHDSGGIASAYFFNGYFYLEQGMYNKSLEYLFKALTVFRKSQGDRSTLTTLNNIGLNFIKLRKNNQAKYYFNQAMNISRLSNDLFSYATAIDNLGRSFASDHQYDSAIKYHQKAISLLRILQTEDVSDSYLSLADIYLKNGETDSAKFYLDSAYVIAYKTEQLSKLKDIYELYIQYFEKTKHPYKALEYYKLLISTKDSIQAEKSLNKMLDMQIDFETAKLMAEKDIQDLKVKRNLNQRNFSIIFAILVLIMAVLIYSRFVIKKKSNAILIEKNNELNIANHTKDKFFTIISHDLKNQLTAFQNISQVLAENFNQIAEEKKHHLIIRINNAAMTLYSVLDNLLIWSSTQLHGVDYQPDKLNIHNLVMKTFTELKLSAEKKEILLTNTISEDITVHADENMTMNILRNLINNSIKFSGQKSEVKVSGSIRNNMVEISVIDQGIGISEADQERLFRIDVSHKEIGNNQDKGAGLGLVISKEFIETMGGKIWVISDPGKGSTFTFSLPING